MGRHDRSGVREVVVIAQREREEVVGFSPMAPLGGRAAKMATQHHLTEATGGALMGR
jgi:hypothetical protein